MFVANPSIDADLKSKPGTKLEVPAFSRDDIRHVPWKPHGREKLLKALELTRSRNIARTMIAFCAA